MAGEHAARDAALAHFADLARTAAHTGKCAFTRFLSPAELELARRAAIAQQAEFDSCGGYDEAERRIARFGQGDADYPLCALTARWNARYSAPAHRDLLGALLALGTEREHFGDILVGEDRATLFVTEQMADHVLLNLTSAGRATLSLSRADSPVAVPPPRGTPRRVTLASLRLDALLAAGFNLSRALAQQTIRSGAVMLNHVQELRTDAQVEQGDILSLRKMGRMRVEEVQGETKKGRIGVMLFIYETKAKP